jgi:hypothetical protein
MVTPSHCIIFPNVLSVFGFVQRKDPKNRPPKGPLFSRDFQVYFPYSSSYVFTAQISNARLSPSEPRAVYLNYCPWAPNLK